MAVRENNEAFILDMCGPDDDVLQSPHIVITFADGVSSDDQAGEMTVSDTGRRFTVSSIRWIFYTLSIFYTWCIICKVVRKWWSVMQFSERKRILNMSNAFES